MALSRRLGLDSIAWSLRRLHCPVPSDALVLEVGSGGNPYYRANVLLDAHEETRERHWVKLIADRPTVIGIVENLPFRDQAFDFVIASHVLEHSANPERFLAELERVARAGYIEVPDALMERLNPYMDHRLEITLRDARLIIRKKRAWRQDEELAELYEHRAAPLIGQGTIPRHPFEFHVRYYWQDRIAYTVLNPHVDAGWMAPIAPGPALRRTPASMMRNALLRLARLALSQRRRNRAIDLIALLRCPACRAGRMSAEHQVLRCEQCGERYEIKDGIPRLARL